MKFKSKFKNFHFRKYILKMSSAKCCQFHLGPNVLTSADISTLSTSESSTGNTCIFHHKIHIMIIYSKVQRVFMILLTHNAIASRYIMDWWNNAACNAPTTKLIIHLDFELTNVPHILHSWASYGVPFICLSWEINWDISRHIKINLYQKYINRSKVEL